MIYSGRKIVIVAVITGAIVGAFLMGVYLGYENRPEVEQITGLIAKDDPEITSQVDFTPFWKTWRLINEKYVSPSATSSTPLSDQDKVWGAISGLVTSLEDPYSVFMPPEEKKMFEEDISGNFGGVGMEIGVKEGVLTVIAPLPNSPAKQAGILSGDKIIRIDDKPTSDLTTDEAVKLIRGEPGTRVHLTMLRGEEKNAREVSVTRQIINIPTIKGELNPRGIYIINLYNFSAISSSAFRQELRNFVLSGSNKLILDLRGNPGGYLEAAVDMASWFLPKGQVIVREHYGDDRPEKKYRSRGYDIFDNKLKMVVLVDRGSASASEILAGALAEYDVATLVGERTFGKGSVQELIPVTKDTSLKITIARWLTPKGHSISENGLEPEYSVMVTEADIKSLRDPQLDKAIELLTR